MRHTWSLGSLGLLLLLVPACTNIVPEPDGAYADISEKTYPFEVVWECAIEAVQQEEFVVSSTRRDGEEEGEFQTEFRIVKQDPVEHREEARRVSVRLHKLGHERYRVQVAASVFGRHTQAGGDWSFEETDPDLVDRIETNMEASFRRRYGRKD